MGLWLICVLKSVVVIGVLKWYQMCFGARRWLSYVPKYLL